jgi:signal transduction histidine kinase
LAESQGLVSGAKRKVDLATRNVERLRRLVDVRYLSVALELAQSDRNHSKSILDVSKLEAGQLVGRFRPVHLDQLTVDMASLFQGIADKKGIKLQVEVQNEEGDTFTTYVDIGMYLLTD